MAPINVLKRTVEITYRSNGFARKESAENPDKISSFISPLTYLSLCLGEILSLVLTILKMYRSVLPKGGWVGPDPHPSKM